MKLPHRRHVLRLAAGAAALPAVSSVALAQSYPSRPVRIVVGAAAGSSPDIVGRLVGQWLSERLGQPFVTHHLEFSKMPGAGMTEFVPSSRSETGLLAALSLPMPDFLATLFPLRRDVRWG